MSHLNRIIILKDQIIMAMTNEMQKLKKEIADLGLQNTEEGRQPGNVQKIDPMAPMAQPVAVLAQQSINETPKKLYNKENVILGDYQDLLNNLKNSEDFLKYTTNEKPTLEELKNALLNNQFGTPVQLNGPGRERVAINHLTPEHSEENKVIEGKRTNLDSVAMPSARNPENTEQMEKLKAELAEMKKTFEEERKKWTQEKEKVLVYQRQLQRNYLQMCKKNECLEEKMQRNMFRETGEPAISI